MYLVEATDDFRSCSERVCFENEEFTGNFDGFRALPREGIQRQEVKDVVGTYYVTKVSKA
jgi:hypothetical protein